MGTARLIFALCLALASSIGAAPLALAASPDAKTHHVTILRDSYGVPHIFAASRLELFYGFGYAQAEDRLFQVEMTRRTATGTVAEVLGKDFLDTDIATRRNFDPKSLRNQFEHLAQKDKDLFEGYVSGYNARLKEVLGSAALLPKEFGTFGFKPQPMDIDGLLAIFVHDFMIRFSGYNGEVDNLRLLTALGEHHSAQDAEAIFDQLNYESDTKTPTSIGDQNGQVKNPPTFTAHARVLSVLKQGKPPILRSTARLLPVSREAFADIRRSRALVFGESNEDDAPHASLGWAAGVQRMAGGVRSSYVDGAQMGFTSPSVVWGVGLHGADLNVEGITLIGVPLVLFGTNGEVVWGGSAGMGDVVDMYQEIVKPDDARQYRFNGKWLSMQERTETVRVKGEDPVQIAVYSTVHGLVKTFDSANNAAYVEKRAWQGIELESFLGWLAATQQTNFEDFRRETARWGISSNWLYADAKGHVSYIYTGRFPNRPANQDFRLPAVGDGSMEWHGFRPYSENPTVEEPTEHMLATWNNLPQPGYHSSDSIYWGENDHVSEIQAQLRAHERVTPEDLWNIVEGVSFVDGNARVMRPLLLAGLKDMKADSRLAAARDAVSDWDGRQRDVNNDGKYDDVGQTLFVEWLNLAQRRLLERDVPPELMKGLAEASAEFPDRGTQVLAHALEGRSAGVTQRYDFLHGKPASQFVQETFQEAVDMVESKYGKSTDGWHIPVKKHVFSPKNFVGVPITSSERSVELPISMNRASFNFWVTFDEAGRPKMCDVLAPSQNAFQPSSGTGPSLTDQLAMYGEFKCKERPLDEAAARAAQTSARQLAF